MKNFFSVVGAGFASLIFLLLAIAGFGAGTLLGGLFFLLAAVICFGPLRSRLMDKLGYEDLERTPRNVILGVVLALGLFFYGQVAEIESAKKNEASMEAERIGQLERSREQQEELKRNRPAIMGKIEEAMRTKAYSEAKRIAAEYDYGDAGIKAALREAEIGEQSAIAFDASKVASVRLQAFKKLEGFGTLNGPAATERDKLLAAKEAEERKLARRKEIERQFSTWDGSHRAVEAGIKARMNDPDSYKHVETKYRDKGATLAVVTVFRGKNGFGGVVTSTAVAEVSEAGELLSLEIARN